LTQPDVLGSYYLQQLATLVQRYETPIVVGLSDIPIPLPFVQDSKVHAACAVGQRALLQLCAVRSLQRLLFVSTCWQAVAAVAWLAREGCWWW
jgi:hypothetical protein